MPNVDEGFFAPRSWKDLERETRRRLRRHVAQPADLEDAVSVGLLAVMDYWVERYTGKIADPQRRFALAAGFAATRGREYLTELVDLRKHECELDGEDTGGEGEKQQLKQMFYALDPDPTAEEALSSDEAAVRETWASLTTAQRRRCARALASAPGRTSTDRMRRCRERDWARGLLRQRACRYGL